MISRSVGARSHNLPPSRSFLPFASSETQMSGTGLVVCGVNGSPFSSSICSQLPWSAVMRQAPPFLIIWSTSVPTQTSTVSTFRLDYESRIVNAIECMKGHIDYALDREKYDESFNSYVLFHLLLIQQHYLFNRTAPWNRRQRYSKYKETLRQPVFADALLSIKYGDFSLTKRVSLFMLKNKVYCLSQIISYIRNIQLSRMNWLHKACWFINRSRSLKVVDILWEDIKSYFWIQDYLL